MPFFLKGQKRSIDSASKAGSTEAADDKSNLEVEPKSNERSHDVSKEPAREGDETHTLEVEEPSLLQRVAKEIKRILGLEAEETNSKEKKREQNQQPEKPKRAEFTSALAKLDELSNKQIGSELDAIKGALKGAAPSKDDHSKLEVAKAKEQADKHRQSEDLGRDPTKKQQ